MFPERIKLNCLDVQFKIHWEDGATLKKHSQIFISVYQYQHLLLLSMALFNWLSFRRSLLGLNSGQMGSCFVSVSLFCKTCRN